MRHLLTILAFILLSASTPTLAQKATKSESQAAEITEQIEIFFDQDKYIIDLDLEQNRAQFEELKAIVRNLESGKVSAISNIEINSYASPEGDSYYNRKLSERRTNSIYDYVTNVIGAPKSLITTKHSGVDWESLHKKVSESNMKYRDEVLHILDNVAEERWAKIKPTDQWLSLVDSRNKHLMELRGGRPYNYMLKYLYPKLRRGTIITIYFKPTSDPIATGNLFSTATVAAPEPQTLATTAAAPQVEEPYEVERPLFALKSNLLFDVATLLNVELEVPIGNRWSVAGEWVFPWWTWDDGTPSSPRHRIQLLNANLEGRYWLGDRTTRPVLTGWNVGIYTGGGLYDFERSAKGYQGEFFIAAGLSCGYAHTINKRGNLRMEYSIGLGYLQTEYRYYESAYDTDERWHPIRQRSGNYTWLGPTRAKVSLVWLLNHKAKRGGVR